MIMLILETFLLMFLAAALGVAIGRLLGEAYGGDEPTDRPWLRDLAPLPGQPQLPSAPTLLPDEERRRLTAAAIEPMPAVAVAPVERVPAPVVVEAAADAVPLVGDDAAKAEAADAVGARPSGTVAPARGAADDLRRIKGIGRQNEARLNTLGVWNFDQIAAWTPENVRWIGSFLAFAGRIEREDWVGQAKVLAAGGTTEFAARVDAGEVPTSSA